MGHTYDDELFSDLYKDAHGFRPRGHEFYDASPARKQELWDQTLCAQRESIRMAREVEAASLREFEANVQRYMDLGAGDWYTAVRWMFDADGFERNDLCHGVDYVCYHYGLSHSNPYRDQLAVVCNTMLDNAA